MKSPYESNQEWNKTMGAILFSQILCYYFVKVEKYEWKKKKKTKGIFPRKKKGQVWRMGFMIDY